MGVKFVGVRGEDAVSLIALNPEHHDDEDEAEAPADGQPGSEPGGEPGEADPADASHADQAGIGATVDEQESAEVAEPTQEESGE